MAISKAGRKILEHQKRIAEINAFAIREGWFIVNDSEIQADDSDDIGRGFKFANDETARRHVLRLAEAGSVLHRDAFELISRSAERKCGDPANGAPEMKGNV